MKVQELFEEKSIGTLSVSPSGDGFMVNASSKSGPIVGAIYWVWTTLRTKKGVTVKMKSGKTVEKTDGMKLFDNRPQGLVFFGVDEATVKAAAEAAAAKTEKEVKAVAQRTADAPKRKAEASKFDAELRKKDREEYAKLYGKGTWNRVTYRQEGGDDGYQYVVRVDGRAIMNGLTRRSAEYEKRTTVDAIAQREKLGKYAVSKV